jgi:hypothetical protein
MLFLVDFLPNYTLFALILYKCNNKKEGFPAFFVEYYQRNNVVKRDYRQGNRASPVE